MITPKELRLAQKYIELMNPRNERIGSTYWESGVLCCFKAFLDGYDYGKSGSTEGLADPVLPYDKRYRDSEYALCYSPEGWAHYVRKEWELGYSVGRAEFLAEREE